MNRLNETKRILQATLECKLIGVTPKGKRVWLNTELKIEYTDKSKEVLKFDRGDEAKAHLSEMYKKERLEDDNSKSIFDI